MQEQTSTKKNGREPFINGIDSHQRVLAELETLSLGEAGNLAVAINKLVSVLDGDGRAKVRSEEGPHREVIDLDSLRDWLNQPKSKVLGETPRSKPVARREAKSRNATNTRDKKSNNGSGVTQAPAATGPIRPAKVFYNGDVTTKVWANNVSNGLPTWSVQLLRVYGTPNGHAEARSFRLDDLRDAMRGAYQAERWIRKNERRYRLLGWFLGY